MRVINSIFAFKGIKQLQKNGVELSKTGMSTTASEGWWGSGPSPCVWTVRGWGSGPGWDWGHAAEAEHYWLPPAASPPHVAGSAVE